MIRGKWADNKYICNLCHPIDSPDPTEDTVKRNLKGVIVNCTTVAINHLKSQHNLTKDDFLLKIRGLANQISRFEEEDFDNTALVTRQSMIVNHTIKPLTVFERCWLNVSYLPNVVCPDFHAQSQIEGEGMRQFLDNLNSSYAAPSHTWVSKIVDQVGDLVRGNIKENLLINNTLLEANGIYCLWHSKGNDDFIGVIVSSIEPVTFIIQSWLLE